MNILPAFTFAALTAFGAAPTAIAAVIDFEDVVMPNEKSYGGSGGGRYWSGVVPPADGQIDSAFVSGNASFANTNNECCGGVTYWSGFAYSNTTDTTSSDFSNQYSAYAGGGALGSLNYAVGFAGEFITAPRIAFDQPTILSGAMVTNTTYAAFSMQNGDGFAKRFGGASGDDPDFLFLTITGRDSTNAVTGTVDFYLADFRAADNDSDYILAAWAFVDLGALGLVSALEFAMTTSDIGAFGANTPLYFAIDRIEPVPLPAAAWLLTPVLVWLAKNGRRRTLRAIGS